jgi:radical SAM superfamily enzyme YgiQ (UPF0313 family)
MASSSAALKTTSADRAPQVSRRDYFSGVFPQGVSRILFVVPADADEKAFNIQTARRGRYWNFPPYGSGVLATLFRGLETKNGQKRECQILNLNHEVLTAAIAAPSAEAFSYHDTVARAIDKTDFEPDLICFSVMFSQTHESLKHAIEVLTQHPRFKHVPLAVGGVHITNTFMNTKTREKLLQDLPQVKFVFTYEAEQSFQDFIRIAEGDETRELTQVYLADFAEYNANKAVPAGEALDVIPSFDLMNTSALSDVGKIGSFYCHTQPGTKIATAISNRGCRAQCTFCSVRNFNGVGVRHRSIKSIVEELKILRYDYDIRHVMWLDDDILKDTKRSIELFNAIADANLGMTFDCSNGVIAASCTDDILSAAVRAGLIGLNIGMESGSKKILREIKKPGTREVFLEAAETLRRFPEINARVFLMIGFPGETYRDILDTFEAAQQMNLDWYNVTILQPLPNTPIFDSMVAQGYIDLSNVNFASIRYNSGGLGKHQQNKKAGLNDVAAVDFTEAFASHDLTEVPRADELDNIWAYMNFHLNFKPLLNETRPIKVKQKLEYIQNLCDIVVPENAFAKYFRVALLNKMDVKVGPQEIAELKDYVNGNAFWKKRFEELDLDFARLQ